ncbi:hypothetical protein ACSFBF_25235 [Variovorax sp. ZT5P49]|uniref:hypothetical protein n=1 Tax=Variovorax sp. ZT5P49 TaxID=3443733 RepID=UPI003F476ED7
MSQPIATRPLKPRIAAENADKAKRNIEAKISLLKKAIAAVQAPKQSCSGTDLELIHHAMTANQIPTTVRQFNAWCSEHMSAGMGAVYPGILRNAQATLKRHPVLLASTQEAIAAIRSHAKRKPTASKLGALEDLRRKMRLLVVIRRIAERELASNLFASEDLKSQLIASEARYAALEREIVESRVRHRDEVAQLRKSNADLTKMLTAVTPLRPSSDDGQ